MAAARHNRPFVMIYGGSIKKGFSKLLNKDVNVSTCYEAAGAFTYGKLHAASRAGEKGHTPSDVMVSTLNYSSGLQLTDHRTISSNTLAQEQELVEGCIQQTPCRPQLRQWVYAFRGPPQIQQNLPLRCVNALRQLRRSKSVWRRTFDPEIF